MPCLATKVIYNSKSTLLWKCKRKLYKKKLILLDELQFLDCKIEEVY